MTGMGPPTIGDIVAQVPPAKQILVGGDVERHQNARYQSLSECVEPVQARLSGIVGYVGVIKHFEHGVPHAASTLIPIPPHKTLLAKHLREGAIRNSKQQGVTNGTSEHPSLSWSRGARVLVGLLVNVQILLRERRDEFHYRILDSSDLVLTTGSATAPLLRHHGT
jgi:hypothetical protein